MKHHTHLAIIAATLAPCLGINAQQPKPQPVAPFGASQTVKGEQEKQSSPGAAGGVPLNPLPKGRSFDQYASRSEFLASAAAYEALRLQRTAFREDAEPNLFSRDSFDAALAPGVHLRFVKVPAGYYTDGITPELKERVCATPNRAGDLRRWEGMFETDRHDVVTVPYDFFLSDVLVTNAMFTLFVRETGYRTTVSRYQTGWIVTSQAQWLQGFANDYNLLVPPLGAPDHPVVQVSWFDAMQFAAWLSQRTGVVFRVPTKEESTLAARPPEMRDGVCLFPWGNEFTALDRRMNLGSRELDYLWVHDQFADGHALTSPVKSFPPTPRGFYDLLGNVWGWNWTNQARFEGRPRGARKALPVALGELGVASNEPMTMLGGCYLARLSHANLLAKMSHPALDGAEDIGFRLAAVRKADSGL